MNAVDKISQAYARFDHPEFRTGDTLRVHFKIREGEKERVQVFEGVCIARAGHRGHETITVRKTSFGIGVERVFPLSSPRIDKIEVAMHGRVRRAKLFYLRQRSGKAARIRERLDLRRKAKS
jgi:large subunit ribosomal protein L19